MSATLSTVSGNGFSVQAVKIRARAFNGVLETVYAQVDKSGAVLVYDGVAGHFVRSHSLSEHAKGRIRAAAKRLGLDA